MSKRNAKRHSKVGSFFKSAGEIAAAVLLISGTIVFAVALYAVALAISIGIPAAVLAFVAWAAAPLFGHKLAFGWTLFFQCAAVVFVLRFLASFFRPSVRVIPQRVVLSRLRRSDDDF